MHTNSQAYAEPGLYSIPYVIGCKLGGTENPAQVRFGAIALSNSGVSVSLDQLSTNGVFDGISVVRGHLKPPRPLALPVHFSLYVWPPPAKLRQKHHCRWSYHTGGCHFLLHLPVLIPVASYRTSPRASVPPSPEGLQTVRGSNSRPTTSSTIASTTPRTTPATGEPQILPRYGHINLDPM